MRIKNIGGLTPTDLQVEVKNGARFVYYEYTISLLVVIFRRTSGVYLIRARENGLFKSLPYTLVTMLLGWWGIPFGTKYTIESITTNVNGGVDVTDDVMATVAGILLFEENQNIKLR